MFLLALFIFGFKIANDRMIPVYVSFIPPKIHVTNKFQSLVCNLTKSIDLVHNDVTKLNAHAECWS